MPNPHSDTGWITMTPLLNGWQATTLGNWPAPPRYRRLECGTVLVNGVLENPTGSGNLLVFNLPAGFRPSGYTWGWLGGNLGNLAGDESLRGYVAPNGDFVLPASTARHVEFAFLAEQ